MDDTDWSDISFETPKKRPPALTSYQALNHGLPYVASQVASDLTTSIAEHLAALPTEIRPKRGGWPKGKPRKAG
jgi:hypothetical protein